VLALLAVVLAVGVGVGLASVEAARRTERAYPDYLRRAGVGDLVINPSIPTDRADEVIASTPGVLGYTSDSLLTATIDDGAPRTQAEVDGSLIQVRASTDGRYTEQDRPVVHDGRMIEHGDEAFLSRETAALLGVHVGDRLPISFWVTGANGVDARHVVESIGRADVRVVGIGVFADEVLVDELYPRYRILVTPEVAGPFDCRPRHPKEDDPRSVEELTSAVFPATCALSYRYYSLRVDGGAGGVAAVSDALSTRFQAETAHLPAALRAADITFSVIPSVTADEQGRVRQSLDPAVTALRLFGVAAVLSTIIVALLGAARLARRDEPDVWIWRQLGMTRSQRSASVAVPLLVAATVGVLLAIPLGWAASSIGPVASARAVEPGDHLALAPGLVLLTVAGAIIAIGAGLIAVASIVSRGTTKRVVLRSSAASRAIGSGVAPSSGLGIRAAVRGAGAQALLGASIAAVTAVLATVVFSTSLDRFVARPAQYGWPFDVGVMVGFGYGGADREAISASLDRPEVASWSVAGVAGGFAIDGQTVAAVSDRGDLLTMPFPVIDGSLPSGADEIGMGSLTADLLGLHVGDTATVSCLYGEREARVSGIVVLPPLGPFQSDRASLGTGVLLPAPFVETIVADGEQAAGVPPATFADGLDTFVAINLRDEVDPNAFIESIRSELTLWDTTRLEPFVYRDPVRPPLVADVASMRGVPVLLGAVFALTMGAGLVLGIAVATRARRRELALLRALGCTARQLRSSVRWHALTIIGIGLLIGLPVGIAVGRTLYRSFAADLGVAPRPFVSPWWTAVVAAATIAMGLVAAVSPGRTAARTPAATVLRNE
jgi:hypothetical protein